MTKDEFLYWLDHSINGKKVIHTCDPHVGCDITFGRRNTTTEVDASYFVNNIWKRIQKRNPHVQFDPQLVWMEIINFIKGYNVSQLTEEEYCNLSPSVAPNFANTRRELYQIYQNYQHYCQFSFMYHLCEYDLLSISKKLYDKCDLVLSLHKGLEKLKETNEKFNDFPWLFDSLYIDEIQDFTQNEILLLLQCCKNPKENVFFTGDSTRSIMGDVSFRFKDLRTLLQKANFPPKEAPEIRMLQINYESHTGIHNLTRFVLGLFQTYYPDSRDIPPSDDALFVGPKPKFIKPCNKDTLMHLLASNVQSSSDIHFGHHQAIIVRNVESERDMPIINALLFSVYECEGLEFDDVLLYNFFSDSKDKGIWKNDFEDIPRTELKYLYTAITRAKGNLWIYETIPNQETELPILRELTKSGEELVEVIEPASLNTGVSFATARKSTQNQWKMLGDALRHQKKWRQACYCFERANRPDLETQTEIEKLEKQLQPNHLERALAYFKADEVAHNVKFIEKAAENLMKAKQYTHAAWIYTALFKRDLAIRTYILGGYYEVASQLYEENESYHESIKVLRDNKCYKEAAGKAKAFENSGISLSDDLSGNEIAKTYIKRYWSPEQKSEEETMMFYGLLEYITDKDLKFYAVSMPADMHMHLKFNLNHTSVPNSIA